MAYLVLIANLLLQMACCDLGQALGAMGSFVWTPRLVVDHPTHDGALLALVLLHVICELLDYLYHNSSHHTTTDLLLDSMVLKDRWPNAEKYRSRRLGWTYVFGDDLVTGGQDQARPSLARSFTIHHHHHPRRMNVLPWKYGNDTIQLLAAAEAFWTSHSQAGAVAVDSTTTPSPPIAPTTNALKVEEEEDWMLTTFFLRFLDEPGATGQEVEGDCDSFGCQSDVTNNFYSNLDVEESVFVIPEVEKTQLPLPLPPLHLSPPMEAGAVIVDTITITSSPAFSPNDLTVQEEEDRMVVAFFMRFLDEPTVTELREKEGEDGEPFGRQSDIAVVIDSNLDAEESVSVIPTAEEPALSSPPLATRELQPMLRSQGVAKQRRSKRIAAVQGPLRRSERIAKRPRVSYKGMC